MVTWKINWYRRVTHIYYFCGVNSHSIVSIGFSCEVEVVSRSSAALLGSIVEARRMMLWPFSSSEVGVGTEPV